METVVLRLDYDGTPIVPSGWDCGERMIEVEPGVWKEPTMFMVENWLRPRIEDALRKLEMP